MHLHHRREEHMALWLEWGQDVLLLGAIGGLNWCLVVVTPEERRILWAAVAAATHPPLLGVCRR